MFGRSYWTYSNIDDVKVEELAEKLNISKATAKILLNRGLEDIDRASKFIRASLEDLYDPFLLKDMDKAVERIGSAIDKGQGIWIYGDYDVDGVSSTSILVKYFRSIGYPANYYIPNRIEEGYGINPDAIQEIHNKGGGLIITVDCGITSVKEVALANSLGIDMIITDHHECQGQLPEAYAIINPKQEDCQYPYEMLCGCGIAFKLIQALTPANVFKKQLYDYIDIVALATIADIVPLVDENRILVKNGLLAMQQTNNIGLHALIQVSGLKGKKLSAGQVGFTIAPRINAAGRIGDADGAVRLLTAEDFEEAMELAELLDKENKHRQQIEADIHQQALDLLENDKSYNKDNFLVLYKEDWHHGVIGIVASRIVEKYYRPVVILSVEGDEAKGSARSIPGFNLFEALHQCKDLFIKFGGHEQAAGLSLKVENIAAFRRKINEIINSTLTEEDFIPEISFDGQLKLKELNYDLLNELERLEPYGMGNPGPKFINRLIKPMYPKTMGVEGKHLRLTLQQKEHRMEAIAFNLGGLNDDLADAEGIDIVYSPEINEYNGNRRIQLNIKDLKIIRNSKLDKHCFSSCYYEALQLSDYITAAVEVNCPFSEVIVTEDKDIVLLKQLRENSPSLIVVNTIYQAIRLLSLSGIQQKKHRIKYRYGFNELSVSTCISQVDIIINPNIDKIDFRRYNKIILYDLFFSAKDFSQFIKLTDLHKTLVLYEPGDEGANEEVLNNIVPTREILVILYKFLMNTNNDRKVYTIKELLEVLKEKIELPNSALINHALDIFMEGKLLSYNKQGPNYEIQINRSKGKINLEELRSYQNAQRALDSFRSFQKQLVQLYMRRK